LDRGKDIWVEKTPHHLYQIAIIQRFVPGARFIHMLRDGRDVTASIYDAGRQDPGYWGEWSPESLARWWNAAVKTSLAYRDDARHLLVSYEGLLDQPCAELERLCDFLQVDFQADMLRHWEAAESVVGWMQARSWGRKPFEPLDDTRLKKFTRVFSLDERSYLEQQLLWSGEVSRVLGKAESLPDAAPVEAVAVLRKVEFPLERR